MRRINTNLITEHEHFASWQKKALAARSKVLTQARTDVAAIKWNEDIWKELKEKVLININFRKCMYCEGDYAAGAYMDGEHYRPKGEVTQDRVKVTSHPGYYWLAYEWQNILLACELCNRQHSQPDEDGVKSSHPGKHMEFPVASSTRVTGPSGQIDEWFEELRQENPLLLHPYEDHPNDHFKAMDNGILYGITDRGKITITVCDLNRRWLRESRHYERENRVQGCLMEVYNLKKQGNPWEHRLFGPRDRYSTYLNLWLLKHVEAMLRVDE